MAEEIINKVAQSGIEQIDLIQFKDYGNWLEIDFKGLLWNELVLREKEFRDWVKEHDWSIYTDQNVCLFCSVDALVPAWAYMLVVAQLGKARVVFSGNLDEAKEYQFFENLAHWNTDELANKIVMVKGCSTIPNPNKAYVMLTRKLQPIVKSLMFGEPCSAVPVFKRK